MLRQCSRSLTRRRVRDALVIAQGPRVDRGRLALVDGDRRACGAARAMFGAASAMFGAARARVCLARAKVCVRPRKFFVARQLFSAAHRV